MPNHVTNRLRLIGNKEQVEAVLAEIGRDVPHEKNRSLDGCVICRKTKPVDGWSVGWLNEETGKFTSRINNKEQPATHDGLPDGWEIEWIEAHRVHIDFEKIIPMPDVVRNTVCGSRKFDGSDEIHNVWYINHDTGEERPLTKEERSILKRFRSDNWYDWSVNHWGTKWNAYDTREGDEPNEIIFDTAWSPPTPVIHALAKRHPAISFVMESVDEGWNFTCVQTFEGESITEKDIPCETLCPEFCNLCLELKGYDPRDEEDEVDRANENKRPLYPGSNQGE